MVTFAALARMALVSALAAGVNAVPSLTTVAEVPTTPDETMATPRAPRMQVCDSGGLGTSTCDVNCHIVFNFYTSQCNVTCRSGYYACCSCDQGCHCIVDHDDMWPVPSPRVPAP
jgi:hypothetical protein